MSKKKKVVIGIICIIVILFVIDLICIYTIGRPLLAIKKGNEKMYAGILYDVYYCDEFSTPKIKLKRTKFCCPNDNINKNKESTIEIAQIKNVSMDIYDISLTGATLIITDTNKNPYTYGEWYKIEKEDSGKWYDVKPIINNYGFNDIAYLVNDNNEVKFIINWEWLYGKLPIGNYRILKQVNNQYIAVEFSIATTS